MPHIIEVFASFSHNLFPDPLGNLPVSICDNGVDLQAIDVNEECLGTFQSFQLTPGTVGHFTTLKRKKQVVSMYTMVIKVTSYIATL